MVLVCCGAFAQAENLLVDSPVSGPRYRCWEQAKIYDSTMSSSISGLIASSGDTSQCSMIPSSVPVWYLVTENWDPNGVSLQNQNPGWNFWVNGGWGSPIQTAAFSNALGLPAYTNSAGQVVPDCRLREVTAIHYHGNSLGQWGNSFIASESHNFSSNTAFLFQAALDHSSAPSSLCTGANGTEQGSAYISADFVVTFPNGVQYLLGVILYNSGPANPYSEAAPYYFTNWTTGSSPTCPGNVNGQQKQLSIDGTYTNLPSGSTPPTCTSLLNYFNIGIGPMTGPVNSVVPTSWTSYGLNEWDLITNHNFLPRPPAPYTWANAYIQSAEVYSSVRGADMGVWVQNVQLTN